VTRKHAAVDVIDTWSPWGVDLEPLAFCAMLDAEAWGHARRTRIKSYAVVAERASLLPLSAQAARTFETEASGCERRHGRSSPLTTI
jgi:hypothetical protein